MLVGDVLSGDVVEPGVVALAHDGDEDVVLRADARIVPDHPPHGAGGDGADAQGVRQEDRRLEQAPLEELRHTRHLARTVQDEAASDDAVVEDVAAEGHHRGQARSHGAASTSDPRTGLSFDERGVPHANSGDVRDRIVLTGGEHTQGDAEVA